MTRWMRTATAATAMATLLCSVAVAKNEKASTSLAPTGVIPGAKGSARLLVKKGSDGRFDVKVQKLARKAHYDLLVGGVKVGSLTTSGGGNGRARFRTAPKAKDMSMGFDPRGDAVSVRDDQGDDVLSGNVPEDGGNDPTEVVCCSAHEEHGTECDHRTADACTAHGGTVSTATSCLPDPCGDSASGALTACCEPDDDDTAECELRTATACTDHHGVALQATSCDPNPCTATFPSTDIQCCLPHGHDGEIECEDRTPDACTAQGGTNMGAGSCNPNPCPGGESGHD